MDIILSNGSDSRQARIAKIKNKLSFLNRCFFSSYLVYSLDEWYDETYHYFPVDDLVEIIIGRENIDMIIVIFSYILPMHRIVQMVSIHRNSVEFDCIVREISPIILTYSNKFALI